MEPPFEHISPIELLPRAPIGRWPTPVEHATRLGARLGVDMWVKRDDLCSDLHGGNKVRKLELLIGDALTRSCRSIVTVGGSGSDHVVSTALHARIHGLETRAVLFPQPETELVRETGRLLDEIGVRQIPVGSRAAIPAALLAGGLGAPDPYVVGPGGSSPLGILGFVQAGLELGRQVREGLLPEPRSVWVPLGTGGTAAGLVIGCRLAGLETRVVAVRVVERVLTSAWSVRWLLARTARLLASHGIPPERAHQGPTSFEVVHGHLGRGYGWPTGEALRAVEIASADEGLALETTYGGKTMAALAERCEEGMEKGPVLLWHTWDGRWLGRTSSR